MNFFQILTENIFEKIKILFQKHHYVIYTHFLIDFLVNRLYRYLKFKNAMFYLLSLKDPTGNLFIFKKFFFNSIIIKFKEFV